MKIPKTLQRFAELRNMEILPVTFRYQGIVMRRKGFDLCEKVRKPVHGSSEKVQYIYFTFEPVDYRSNGDKWFLRHTPRNYTGPDYLKRLYPTVFKKLGLEDENSILMVSHTCR